MRNTRKALAAALAVICGLSLAACGAGAENKSESAPAGTTAPVSETTAETAAATETQAEEPAPVTDPDRQKTLDTFRTLGENIYSMDVFTDYKLEDYLKANINNVDDFDAWLTENITDGVPTGKEKSPNACSSFTAADAEGHRIFGRDYDQDPGSSMVVRTFPKEGYSSIGVVDLSHLNIGKKCDYDIGDSGAESLLMAAPWGVCDGLNEKGLGVSVLALNEEHIVNDTEKGDLLIYAMTRILLDKCATIDEALDLLSGYDAYSPGRRTYHLFLTDLSGKSVIVEWLGGNMYTVEDDAVTNFVLHDNPDHTGDADARYVRLRNKLDGGATLNDDTAMELLLNVAQNSYSRWSALYDINDFSLDVCFAREKTNVYSFSGR